MTQWGNDRPQPDEPEWNFRPSPDLSLPPEQPTASQGWPSYAPYQSGAYAMPGVVGIGYAHRRASGVVVLPIVTALLAAASFGFLFLPWVSASASDPATGFSFTAGGDHGSTDAFTHGFTVVWAVLLILAAAAVVVGALTAVLTGRRWWSRATAIAAGFLAAFALAEFAYIKGLLDVVDAAIADEASAAGSGITASIGLGVGGWLTLVAALLAFGCAVAVALMHRSDLPRQPAPTGTPNPYAPNPYAPSPMPPVGPPMPPPGTAPTPPEGPTPPQG